MSDEQFLYVNGINAETGDYAIPPQSIENVVKFATTNHHLKSGTDEHGALNRRSMEPFPLPHWIAPQKLSETGWGIIFAKDEDPAIIDALRELIEHRKNQVNNEKLFKEFSGARGFETGQSKRDFLRRHAPQAANSGIVLPENGMPYYLLIVGSPEKISYEFQYQLDIEFGVGRIEFDTPGEYAQYAHNVVVMETSKRKLDRNAAFFGVRNDNDQATQLSAKLLINPLFDDMQKKQKDWNFQKFLADEGEFAASKTNLHHLLHTNPPAFLFTASHGLEFPKTEPEKQFLHQGALLCQEWPGPTVREPVKEEQYFSGVDLAENANLMGTIAFFFACYGAGTPKLNQFYRQEFKSAPTEIAERSFIANLPRQMLLRGALAVVGHVERAWGYSFTTGQTSTLGNFQVSLSQIMNSDPIGYALDSFNLAYASSAAALTDIVEDYELYPDRYTPYQIAESWTMQNDTRGYVVIGDPAVRIPMAMEDEQPTERPPLEIPTISPRKDAAVETPADSQPTDDTATDEPTEESTTTGEAASFGLWSKSDEGEGEPEEPSSMEQVKDSLANAIKALTTKLGEAFEDVATVKVSTFVMKESIKQSTPIPRAYTEIQLDGDMKTHVPTREDGEVDREIWSIHKDMVEQARLHRVEMLKLLLSAIPGQQHLKK